MPTNDRQTLTPTRPSRLFLFPTRCDYAAFRAAKPSSSASRMPSGDRGYGRMGILRDTYQSTTASAAVITPPRIKVVIDGKIIFGLHAGASYRGAAGFG
jgi:hypothetical protein